MKILVCGSRSWRDGQVIEDLLADLALDHVDIIVIHGGASGADSLGKQAAERLGLQTLEFRPDWAQHGRKAGILRNRRMLDEKPDLVLAFWDGRSPGTKDTIEEARRRGIQTVVVEPR